MCVCREKKGVNSMSKGIKIATIGGGSSYTPELMEGFIKRYHELPIKEIWLVDVEEGMEKVSIDAEMAQRMWDAAGYDVKIYATLDRTQALKNADFVTTQFRVGFLEARIKDERIPLSYGMLGQETNGAGGIFKALRTIPVILGIVEDMKKLCPNAWLINFTNPSGMITEAVIKYGHWKRCIGLCNVPVIAMMKEPEAIGFDKENMNYQFVGLNHFHWHKVFDNKGNELTSKIIEAMLDGKDVGLPANINNVPFFDDQIRHLGMIPCGYHRYYYRQEEMVEHSIEEMNSIGTRGQQVKKTEEQLFDLYKDPMLDHKPVELSKRGGAYYSDAACECINAIYNNKNIHMVVSTQNNGAVSDLNDDAIVEVSCLIGGNGARPLAWGSLPSAPRGWLQVMKAMEECTIEAAVTGDYGALLEAFTINPLIPMGASAKRVCDELLVAHQKYLPQFEGKIKAIKKEGLMIKDSVVRGLVDKGL